MFTKFAAALCTLVMSTACVLGAVGPAATVTTSAPTVTQTVTQTVA